MKKEDRIVPFEPVLPDLPDIANDLNKHEWIQRGHMLKCLDNPNLSAAIPPGMNLVGTKGAYRLEKELK